MNYQDALDRALSLAGAPAELEAFLRTVPQWRDNLERALTVSRSVAQGLREIAPDAAGTQRAQRQLMSAVDRLSTAGQPSWQSRLLQPFGGYRLALAGLTAVALIVFGIVAGLPSFSGSGTQTAEAVIEGSVAEVGAGAVTISTRDANRVVQLSSDTVLTDGFGNTVESSRLSAGQDVVLKGSGSGDDFVASEVELRDRLFGSVTALSGDGIQLSSSKGEFLILVTPETEFEGLVKVGSFIEVKLVRQSDGTLRALEVEVEDADEGDEGDDDHGGPGGESANPPPSASPAEESKGGGSGPSVEDGGNGGDDGSHEDDSESRSGSEDGHEDGGGSSSEHEED
jgi:hypothetical protein